ncbi:speckle-type POZ [Fusarium denticulatum]|uniref:Speckle-type POZ n=1 Tax=Fusarium denticulatum TaxID=48507 RepID=A0A8H5TMT3_9HYPO|nr:speckle-type POZ [Fusarium denticulatum]
MAMRADTGLACNTAHGATELWEWTKQNWERVEKEVHVDIVPLFLGTALEGLHTKDQIEDVRAFFGGREEKITPDQSLERMENRRSWAERDISDVRSWLEGHGYLLHLFASHLTTKPHQSNRSLATMPPQPHSVLMHLLQSGEYSDFILRCKDREFKLHQMIVCPQSPVISAALNGGFEESTSRVITVNEFDVRTVQYMVGFLYSADYRLAPEPEKQPAQGEKREEGEIVSDDDNMTESSRALQRIADETVYKIVSHLRVNAIADYYGIAKLAKLSTRRIDFLLKSKADFSVIPQTIAEMATANRDPETRSVIASATARYIEELTASRALQTIDLEHQLTIEILEACGTRIQKLVEDLSAANEVNNKHKETIRKLEGDRDLAAEKVRNVMQQVHLTTKCRNCKKDFGCYVEEPANILEELSRYVIRCRGCLCRHQ